MRLKDYISEVMAETDADAVEFDVAVKTDDGHARVVERPGDYTSRVRFVITKEANRGK